MLFFILACQSSSPQQTEPLSDNVVVEMPQYEPLPCKRRCVAQESVSLETCLDRVPSCQCWMGSALKEECGPQYIYEIIEIPHLMSEEMRQHTWTEECPTKLEDLRLLRMLHWTDKGSVQWGEVVLTERVITAAASIFQDLYLQRFPIHSLKPAVEYRGSDEASMADNNSSASTVGRSKEAIDGRSILWRGYRYQSTVESVGERGTNLPENSGEFASRETRFLE